MFDYLLNIQVPSSSLFAVIDLYMLQIMIGLALLGITVDLRTAKRNLMLFIFFYIAVLSAPVFYQESMTVYFQLITALIYVGLIFSTWRFAKFSSSKDIHWFKRVDIVSLIVVSLYSFGLLNNLLMAYFNINYNGSFYSKTHSVVTVTVDSFAAIALFIEIVRSWYNKIK